jgi:hypothetical protein
VPAQLLNITSRTKRLLRVLVLFSGVAGSAFANPVVSLDSIARRISEHEYIIGTAHIDTKTRLIVIPGWVNQTEGPVEYFAVTPKGKLHESVLALEVQPLHLQLALLLLGLEYHTTLGFQGDTLPPSGDSVVIRIAWVDSAGISQECNASEFLWDLQKDRPVDSTPWVFTGSMLWEGQFAADIEGSIIATYSDPTAILNNPSAGRMDDTVYGANPKRLPKRETKVSLVIRTF